MRNWSGLLVAVMAGFAVVAVPALAQVVKPVEFPANPNQPKANNAAEKALYDAATALGMIRFKAADRKLHTDIIDVIEFTGAGTWNGQKVNAVTVGYDYVYPAARVNVDKGAGAREITVANGKVAWDESKPGVYLKAAATPAADRLRDMWLIPQGIILAGTKAMDKLKVADKGGQRELTVTTPDGVEVKALLDAKGFIVHTEATIGGKLYAGDFSNFVGDGMDYEVMFPSHLVLKVDGTAYADLALGKTPAAKLSAGGPGEPTLVPAGNNFFPDPYMPFPIPKEVATK